MRKTKRTPTPPDAPPTAAAEPDAPLLTLRREPENERKREQEADDARDRAVQAVPFSFKGRVLAPFTPSRERAFHEHRESLNAQEWHLALTSATAFMADGARMLYFLAHDPADWLNFLALQEKGTWTPDPADPRNREKMQWKPMNAHAMLEVIIQKWTDETMNGTIEERNEIYRLCQEIMLRARVTRARIVSERNDDSGN